MKKAFVAAAAVLLLAGASFATLVVEADLDGTLGNGPDYLVVSQSALVPVDLWILGDVNPAYVFGMFLCNYDHSLVYQSTVYNLPGGGWQGVPPVAPTPDGCITVQGQNFLFDMVMVWPWKVATVTYHAAVDQSIDEIWLGGPDGGVLTSSFTSVAFDNIESVLGRVQIGETNVEETNWGAVKSLFR